MVNKTRRVKICMAPSFELTDKTESSLMGNLIEQMISRDYLWETRQHPPKSHEPVTNTQENFIDNGDISKYKSTLLERHPQLDPRDLSSRKSLKIPDISTYGADFRERAAGISISYAEGPRNEIYEIKPNNESGEYYGLKKLDDISDDFLALRLTPKYLGGSGTGYVRGTWYPPEARRSPPHYRKIEFKAPAALLQGLLHHLKRWSEFMLRQSLAVRVKDFYVELARKKRGLLQYRICVEIELDSDSTKAFENAVAAAVVRLIFDYLVVVLNPSQREATRRLVSSLQPMEQARGSGAASQDPKVSMIDTAFRNEAQFKTSFIELVDELDPMRQQMRAVLYTRNRAMPGDVFLVACDENYFQQEILDRRQNRFAGQVNMLSSLQGPSAIGSLSGISVARSMILTKDQVIRILASEHKKFVSDPQAWYEEHKNEIKTAVTIVVVVTAMVVLIVLTSGLAAPVLAVEGTVASSAVAAGSLAIEGAEILAVAEGSSAVVASSSALVEGIGVAAAVEGSGAGATLAVEAGLTAEQLAALRFGLAMRQAQSTTALGNLAREAALADGYLAAQAGGAAPASIASLNNIALASLSSAQLNDSFSRIFAENLQSGLLDHLKGQMIKGGPAVALLSTQRIVSRPQEATSMPKALNLGTGKLYLLKIKSKDTLKNTMRLESEFDWSQHSDDLSPERNPGAEPAPKRLRYMGTIVTN